MFRLNFIPSEFDEPFDMMRKIIIKDLDDLDKTYNLHIDIYDRRFGLVMVSGEQKLSLCTSYQKEVFHRISEYSKTANFDWIMILFDEERQIYYFQWKTPMEKILGKI